MYASDTIGLLCNFFALSLGISNMVATSVGIFFLATYESISDKAWVLVLCNVVTGVLILLTMARNLTAWKLTKPSSIYFRTSLVLNTMCACATITYLAEFKEPSTLNTWLIGKTVIDIIMVVSWACMHYFVRSMMDELDDFGAVAKKLWFTPSEQILTELNTHV